MLRLNLHNLSLQALNRDDSRVQLQFDAIIRLNRNFKKLIRDDKRKTLDFVDFKPQVFKQIKEPTQLIEEEVVNSVINGTQMIICKVIIFLIQILLLKSQQKIM